MKIGLGTVQFGLDYGVSNFGGQTSFSEAEEILKVAAEKRLRVLDTAGAYGNSEEVIGQLLCAKHDFKIVTKISKKPDTLVDINNWISQAVTTSLHKLRQESVYGILMHSASDLLDPHFGNEIYETLLTLKQAGIAERIGASIYDATQIDELTSIYSLDLLQVPVNIFDQRLISSGHLARLKSHGVEIHARSVFLQGLLLMDWRTAPEYFKPYLDHLAHYQTAVKAANLSLTAAALGFALSQAHIDQVICGVNDSTQLRELLHISENLPTERQLGSLLAFSSDEPGLINPATWAV